MTTTKSVDYCMLVMGMVNVMSLLIKARSELGFRFGDRAWTEMEIWCAKGKFMLK